MPEAPLSAHERIALRRWERTQILLAVAFLGLLAVLVALEPLGLLGDAAVRTGIALGLFLLALFGVRHRLALRCPRCDYHLGRAFRLLLPDRCPSCDVALDLPE